MLLRRNSCEARVRRAADDPAIYICLECFAEFRAEPVGEVDADAADNNGQYGLFTASDEE